MAHPDDPEAGGVPVSYDEDSAAAALADMNLEPEGDEDDDIPAEEGELDESDLTEGEDEGEQDDEPGEPAIAPPVSLNAEEKAKFAQLPSEAQRLILDVETRRNAQVQEATTKASAAQREAEARAAAADAEAKGLYAKQLREFVGAFEPTQPDPNLAYQDPARYVAEKAQYDAAKAQHDALVQQISGVAEEASTEARKAFIEQRDRDLMAIPEIANPETRASAVERAMNTAKLLGYDTEQLANFGDANDIKALLQIADFKAKADKYDQAMSRKMQKVRAGKPKTLRPNAAQPESSGRQRAYTDAHQRLKSSGRIEDATAALAQILG